MFRDDSDTEIRKFALENNFVETILDRIGIISKEDKRQWIENL